MIQEILQAVPSDTATPQRCPRAAGGVTGSALIASISNGIPRGAGRWGKAFGGLRAPPCTALPAEGQLRGCPARGQPRLSTLPEGEFGSSRRSPAQTASSAHVLLGGKKNSFSLRYSDRRGGRRLRTPPFRRACFPDPLLYVRNAARDKVRLPKPLRCPKRT